MHGGASSGDAILPNADLAGTGSFLAIGAFLLWEERPDGARGEALGSVLTRLEPPGSTLKRLALKPLDRRSS
jgi:hypothetical protein